VERSGQVATHLAPHPFLPNYISGGQDGAVCVWQFAFSAPLGHYRTGSSATLRVNRAHFNPTGSKFGVVDEAGNLLLWRFDASEASQMPFLHMQCHSKRALDFAFLNSGSLLATGGLGQAPGRSEPRNLALWDVLVPPHKALVCAWPGPEHGASSLRFSPAHQLLLVGGKKGELQGYDVRQRRPLFALKAAHAKNVRSMALDASEELLVTAGAEGTLKVWSLQSMMNLSGGGTLEPLENWPNSHPKHTFVRGPGGVQTFSITQVEFAPDDHTILSCGADGSLRIRAGIHHH
jgi:WD40 repeat protein